MNLGIVGHAAEKFTAETEAAARATIREAIALYRPERILSGHSPMGGVDRWAEDAAIEAGIPLRLHVPRVHTWRGDANPFRGLLRGREGASVAFSWAGFHDRNLAIARESDLVLCVVVRSLPPGFSGMRFPRCYHCAGKRDAPGEHVKSGGCWTARRCRRREWRVVGG